MPFHWRYQVVATLSFAALFSGVSHGASPAVHTTAISPKTYVAYYYKLDQAATPVGAYLVPVVFPLPDGAYGTESLRLAFQALCDQPPSGLIGALQSGCKVGSAKVAGDGTLMVDYAAGEVFQRAGTTGDAMVVEQLAMTAKQFNALRVIVAYQGKIPADLGSHGVGNNFQATGRSRRFLVTPSVKRGHQPETESLRPGSSAIRNATRSLSRPLLGVINRRLSELGRTEYLVKEVEQIIPSGDGSLWVKVPQDPGLYRLWWAEQEWKVDGL